MKSFALLIFLLGGLVATSRWYGRRRRRYVRMRVETYRTDKASAEAVVSMFEALHKRLLRRWWRRLLRGQPSVALEVHHTSGAAWLAVACPLGLEEMVQAALRTAYPNCRLVAERRVPGRPPAVLRLKKHAEFIKRGKVLDRFEHEREPPMNRLMTVMSACASEAFVQVAMTPTPSMFERHAKRLYKRHEARLSRERRDHLMVRDRSMVEDIELRGGLDIQHRPLFFVDLRVIAPDREKCERIASELRAEEERTVWSSAERPCVTVCWCIRAPRAARRGQSAAVFSQGVFASTELAAVLASAVDRLHDCSLLPRRPCPWRPRHRRSCVPRTGLARCAMRWGRCRSIQGCASRTRRCLARWSRASPAISWPRWPRICAESTAR